LAYKAGLYRNLACNVHAFLDDDAAGRVGFEKAFKAGLIGIADVNLSTCPGMADAEIEDLYDQAIYATPVLAEFGVDVTIAKPGGQLKWSDRLKQQFHAQGKPWDEKIEARLKSAVARAVADKPLAAIHPAKSASFDALVASLENKPAG
jgi:hypothetical protein